MKTHPEHAKTCKRCGKTFYRFPSQGKLLYCSASCASSARGPDASIDMLRARSIVSNSGCWVWQRGKTSAGYGAVSIDRTYWLTHRLAYFLSTGIRPARETVIRHKCDNPSCVNPDHLEAGTIADNTQDAKERGRMNRGSQRYCAKLHERDIPTIRQLIASKVSYSEIGRRFGVDSRAISCIAHGRTWTHV